ncbi:hypothetical protein [Emticicia soli]|uniref:Uncharacterized protein n=1 Tax=Emticicia soli TaxID=2027878 RepID=A0ABW5J7Q4_9BACT
MRKSILGFFDWLVNREKYDEIEKFFLENYPPCKDSSPLIRIDCKLYKLSDLVEAFKREKGMPLNMKVCAEILHKLGYKQIYARESFSTTYYKFWLIKR